MTDRYTDRQLRKSAENRNEHIPDSFINKLMNTLDSLPEEPAEKETSSEQAAVIKHSSSSNTIKMTVSAAAAFAIFAGSAVMYGRIRKNTDNSSSPESSSPVSGTVTTCPEVTTGSSVTSDTSQSEAQITESAFQAVPEAPLPEIIAPGSENNDPAPGMPVPPENSTEAPPAVIPPQDPVISGIPASPESPAPPELPEPPKDEHPEKNEEHQHEKPVKEETEKPHPPEKPEIPEHANIPDKPEKPDKIPEHPIPENPSQNNSKP